MGKHDRSITDLFLEIVNTFGVEILDDREGLVSCMRDIEFSTSQTGIVDYVMGTISHKILSDALSGNEAVMEHSITTICSKTMLDSDAVHEIVVAMRSAKTVSSEPAVRAEKPTSGFREGMMEFRKPNKAPDYRKAYSLFEKDGSLHSCAMMYIMNRMHLVRFGYDRGWDPRDTDRIGDEPDLLWIRSMLVRYTGNAAEADRLLRESAEEGSLIGMYVYYEYHMDAYSETLLEEAARSGYYPAMRSWCTLPRNLIDPDSGDSVPMDVLQMRTRLADQGDLESKYVLGCLYLNGKSVPRSYIAAFDFFIGCASYTPDAPAYIGDCISLGDVGPQKEEATRWYATAASRGSMHGKLRLAYLEITDGDPAEKEKGLHIYRRLIASGHGRNVLTDALSYCRGRDVPEDTGTAFLLLEELYGSEPEAAYWLGMMYMDGRGTAKNPMKALEMFKDYAVRSTSGELRKKAEARIDGLRESFREKSGESNRHDSDYLYRLGLMYLKLKSEDSKDKARHYLEMAADMGDLRASAELKKLR